MTTKGQLTRELFLPDLPSKGALRTGYHEGDGVFKFSSLKQEAVGGFRRGTLWEFLVVLGQERACRKLPYWSRTWIVSIIQRMIRCSSCR